MIEEEINEKFELAKKYYYGIGTEQDYDKAYDIFNELAEKYEHINSKKFIAEMYYLGVYLKQDNEKAYEIFNELAEKHNDEDAKMYLDKIKEETSLRYDERISLQHKKNRDRLSYEEKYNLMIEYMNKTGEEIATETKYKGYNLGYLRNNLRQMYYNGTLNIEDDLLDKFIKAGIIKEGKERIRTSQQEKYDFLMSLANKTEDIRKNAKIKNGLTYREVKNQLQVEYNRNNIKLTDEQIDNLKKQNILGYSKEEIKKIEDNYQMPSKYAIDIMTNYGSIETFKEEYKKCQCNYDFNNEIFSGFRGITISQNDMSEYQKLQYALAAKDILSVDISEIEFNTGKYLDIDEFESMLMILPERERNIYRLYSSLDGKKYTYKEIGNMFEISGERVSQIINKTIKKLRHPSRSRYIIGDYRKNYREIEEYNNKINEIKSEIENLQIIDDYFLNTDYKLKNIELSKIIVNKDKLEKLKEENIVNIQELIKKCENKMIASLKEIDIYDLNLSARTYNCLKRSVNNLYDLISLEKEKFSKIRNFGKNSYEEVIHKLTELGLYMKKDAFGELEFSTRTEYCLKRAGITKLNDLLNLTEDELLKVEGLGHVIYNEIIEKISIKGLSLRKESEETNKSIAEYEELLTNKSDSMADYFKFYKKISLEKLENIFIKKEGIQNKIERYYKAVEQYLNKEDIFNSEYNIPAIDLGKENIGNLDDIKTLLADLKIISDDIIEYENTEQVNEKKNIIESKNNGQGNENIKSYIKRKIEELNKNDKDIPKIEWKLENDKEDIYQVDKYIIELELSKIDSLESDWLVLEPSKSIKNTNFIQICIDEEFEDSEEENHRFHVELGYEDIELGVISIAKDGLTMKEALKIFIDYYENNTPDIEDWYIIEL